MVPKIDSSYAVSSYKKLAHESTLTPEAQQMALRGFPFTQPDELAYGNNPFTNGAFGGLLNQNGNYYKDPETGDLVAPTRTFCCIG